jgi:endonuclease YncB( thermonuclease family)
MQFGDRFVASLLGACAVGIGIGVLLVYAFGRVEPASRAFDEPSAAVEPAPAEPAPSAPDLGVHAVQEVVGASVVTLEGLGPVRLLGIEVENGPGGKPVDPDRARAVLQQIAAGKQVVVLCDPATADTAFKDDNGAWLVYLMRDDGVLVNTELLARGAAVADLDRPYARRDEFVRAERDARWNGRGLWETAVAAKPLPPSPLMPDPRRLPTDVAPAPTPGKNDVLVTKDGRFHRPSCKLSKGGVVMAAADARGKHYLACPVCFSSPRVKI